MPNLSATPGWDAVPLLELTTPALGGVGGPMNGQAQALLNRTEQLDANKADTADLAANDTALASALITQPTEYTDEQPTKVFAILRGRANAKRFWVSGDGADWTNAFNKMINSGARNLILPGDVAYQSIGGHSLLDGQDLYWDNASVTLTSDTARLFSAMSKSRWSMRGRGEMIGSLTTAASAVETGLYIENGKRYTVEGLTGRNFKGRAIHLAGTDAGSFRGDRGTFNGVSAFECTTGIQVDVGAGSEYNDWYAPHVTGCVIGFLKAAGNNSVHGGTIVDNATGVKITNGANHAHGGWYGTAINHNQAANIWAVGVINGETFDGCHIYGNGGTSGPIWFDGCRGMLVANGIIDCPIYNDSGTNSGANKIFNNYMPDDYGVSYLSNNSALGQLFKDGNFGKTGPHPLDDPAPMFVNAARGTAQTLTANSAVTAVMTSETSDIRGAYDNATGVYTVPTWAGGKLHNVAINFTISAAGGLTSGSYVQVRVAGVVVGYIPVVAVSATLGLATGDVKCTPAAAAALDVQVFVNNGATTPTLAVSVSRMIITAR